MVDDRGRLRRREGEHVLDVVRPGSRPPGVPTTSPAAPAGARDLGAETKRALARFLAMATAGDAHTPVLLVEDGPFGHCTVVNIHARLSPAAVDRLLALVDALDR